MIFGLMWNKIVVFFIERKEKYITKKEKQTKTHYECCVCGDILVPYFMNDPTPTECGWKKIDGRYWLCHQCFYHSYAREKDRDKSWEYTWEQWQGTVEENRKLAFAAIKKKDESYYYEWFGNS